MWTCRISNHADFESLMPWACLWLFVYVTMAIVIVYYYGNIWHVFDSLPGILVTNGALQIGTTLIEYANLVFQTWWSKHEASVSSYFCGSAAYNPVGGNLFWRNIFLSNVPEFSQTVLTIEEMSRDANKLLIATWEGIWTYGDTGQCAALNREWNMLELYSLLYI